VVYLYLFLLVLRLQLAGRVENKGHRSTSRSGVKVEVRVSKDGIGVASTSILDRKQLVGGVA